MTKTTHDIRTVRDLRAALNTIKDAHESRRVVVMVDGEVVACELTWRECGDWCVLNIIEPSTEKPTVTGNANSG